MDPQDLHPDWHEEVLRLTGGAGVDRVIEIGGAGTYLAQCRDGDERARCCDWGVGRGCWIDPLIILQRRLTVQAISTGSREMFEDMNRAIARWRLRPLFVGVFPFSAAREAYAYLAGGNHVGKVVIERL